MRTVSQAISGLSLVFSCGLLLLVNQSIYNLPMGRVSSEELEWRVRVGVFLEREEKVVYVGRNAVI